MPVDESYNPNFALQVSVSMTPLWDEPIWLPSETYKKI